MQKRVLVTGANRGIGKAIALGLAEDGFEIAINYKSGHNSADITLQGIIDSRGKPAFCSSMYRIVMNIRFFRRTLKKADLLRSCRAGIKNDCPSRIWMNRHGTEL